MFLSIIIFIIGIILCLIGLTNIYKKHQKNEEIDKENKELKNINDNLKWSKEILNEKCNNLEKDLKDKTEKLLDTSKKIESLQLDVKTSFSNYCELLEKQYIKEEENYDNSIIELKNKYQNNENEIIDNIEEIKKELEKLKNTRTAAIQALKKEEEIENQLDFYRLQIDEQDKKEIKAIKSIEYLFRDSRPLNMMIWSNYYLKKANALCSNILSKDIICGIYKITNINNKMCYIGQAKNIKERLREHMKHGLGIDCPSGNKLYELMKKEGLESFTFEVLEECNPDILNEKEKFYIDLYDSCNNGLNNNKGIGINKYI